MTLDVLGTPVRVISADHLAALALESGRAKDKARVLLFVESDAIDKERFVEILSRHGLVEKWNQFKKEFQIEP